ncbi:MAG: hypothetical protein AAF677_13335 [Pseudomonadota bacterium]
MTPNDGPQLAQAGDPDRPPPPDANRFPLANVRTGSADKRDREILDVLWAVAEYKIYKTARGISPHFADDDGDAATQRQHYLALGRELAEMNHLIQLVAPPYVKWLFRRLGVEIAQLTYYEREMARGIAQALEGDPEQGRATLTALARRVERRIENRGRVMYFAVTVVVSSLIMAGGVALLEDQANIDWQQIGIATVMGALGALFSAAAGLKAMKIDTASTTLMSWIYGAQRMLVGVLGAVVLYFALRAGFFEGIVPTAVDGSGTVDADKLAFLSILAGFSERLVPNLLDRESDAATSDRDPPARDGPSPAGDGTRTQVEGQ